MLIISRSYYHIILLLPLPDFRDNMLLQDEETGAWYQHRGMDFKMPLVDYLEDDGNTVGVKRGFGVWSGC